MHNDKHTLDSDDRRSAEGDREQPSEFYVTDLGEVEPLALDTAFDERLSDTDLTDSDAPEDRDPLEALDRELDPSLAHGDRHRDQAIDDFDLDLEKSGATEAHAAEGPAPGSSPTLDANDRETDISRLFATLDPHRTETATTGKLGSEETPQALDDEPLRPAPILEGTPPTIPASQTYADNRSRDNASRVQAAPPTEGNNGPQAAAEAPPPAVVNAQSEQRERPAAMLTRVGIGLAAMALTGATLSTWHSHQQAEQIEQLRTALQQRTELMLANQSLAASDVTTDAVRRLQARLDAIEHEWIETRQAVEQRIQAVATAPDADTTRLADLGRRVESLEQRLQKQAAAPAPAKTRAANRSTTRETSASSAAKHTAAPSTRNGVTSTGDWEISLASLSTRTAASRELDRLKELGINAAMRRAQVDGSTRYRLVVPGFGSRQAAQREAALLQKRAGSDQIWVKRGER